MTWEEFVVAVLAGLLQGVLEWLPVSSEGNLSIFFAAVGQSADAAVQLSLFLHLGTTLAAAVYYRADLAAAASVVPSLRDDRRGESGLGRRTLRVCRHPSLAFDGPEAEASFVVVATATTGLVGVPAYVLLVDAVSELSGGALVALIGVLLVVTGVLQRTSESVGLGEVEDPSLFDAVAVGAAQGLAVLPGVSRSGVTTSTLLFTGHDASAAFRLSFLLSIPAGIGAAVLIVADVGGLPAIGLGSALVALAVTVIVGYAAIDVMLRIVERIPFWAVCFGLGGLAILGGGLAALVGA